MSSAPRIFTKVLKPNHSYFKIIGIICSYFLDDTSILVRTFQETSRHTEIVFDTLVSLGFVPKILKCSLIPSTRVRHSEFYIDSIMMTVELPQHKVDTIVGLATDLPFHEPSCYSFTFQNLSVTQFIASPQLNWDPYFIESLEKDRIHSQKENNFSYDAKTTLSDQSKQDQLWWIKCVNCSKTIKPRTPSVLIFSDASDEAFGAHVISLSDGSVLDFTQGNWSPIGNCCHIHTNQCKGNNGSQICFVLIFLNARNLVTGVLRDNSSVVMYLNHVGGLPGVA